MKVNTQSSAKTIIHVDGKESPEDIVADMYRLVIDAGRLKNLIYIHFPQHYFDAVPDRLAIVMEWIDRFVIDAGAVSDFVLYFDPVLNRFVQCGTADNREPLGKAMRA